jgi:hypothetical protein
MIPHKQMFSYIREESDLPPQVPNHLLRNSKNPNGKKNVRIRSVEDTHRQRRTSISTTHNDDGATSQMGTNRSQYGPSDLVHRPLWNYHNPQHREYVPNSKRDPHYDKHQRQEDSTRNDDVKKKKTTIYHRGNSDTELQQDRKFNTTNRTRTTVLKHKEERIVDLPKGQTKKEAFVITKPNDESSYNNISSLDKYEHFTPYIRTDEVLDPAKAYSPIPQSRETSAHKQRSDVIRDFFLFLFII